MMPLLAMGGAALGGMAMNAAGSLFQNDWQSDEAEFARNHSAQQAAINRDYQERMSGTSYQRAVGDMKAAGLNPMLAYQHGGASTPSGAQGAPVNAAPMHNPFAAIGPTTAAQVRNIDADTEMKKAETGQIREQTPTHEVTRESLRQQIGESAMRIEKIIAETDREQASASNIKQQTKNLQETIPQIRATIENLKAATKQTGTLTEEAKQRVHAAIPILERQIKQLELTYKGMEMPARETTHAFESSPAGSVLRTIKETLRDLIPGLGVLVPIGRHNTTTHKLETPRK